MIDEIRVLDKMPSCDDETRERIIKVISKSCGFTLLKITLVMNKFMAWFRHLAHESLGGTALFVKDYRLWLCCIGTLHPFQPFHRLVQGKGISA